jgi:CheY-like chemotaxis protein
MAYKILIVDDEPDVRLLLRRRLESNRREFQLFEAGNGEEALQQIKASVPDLIILDLKMPGQDGIQVFAEVRKEAAWEKIPVIFLTALASNDTMTKESLSLIAFSKHGIELKPPFAVMGKPYEALRLVAKIREMVKPS